MLHSRHRLVTRKLYAMNKSTDELVEIPRWVRLLDGKRWFGGPGLSRRDVHVIEVFCLACAAPINELQAQGTIHSPSLTILVPAASAKCTM